MILRAYFDDAGTHADSEVVVLAGLIGTEASMGEFQSAMVGKAGPATSWKVGPQDVPLERLQRQSR
jgi:hypothetical protein